MPRLHVRMLGGLALRWDEHDMLLISNTAARSLLAYLLARRDSAHTRDLLSGLFWPNLPEATSRRRLTQALWKIRSHLAPHSALLTEGDIVRLDPTLHLWLDVEAFELCAKSDSLPDVARAVTLYQGEFLDGYYDDWLLPERERLSELYQDAMERLIAAHKVQGDYQSALVYARRLAAEDPWRESAHREVMRLFHRLGRDSEAFKQYQLCWQILSDDLGLEPEPKTQALAAEIARQSPPETAPYLPTPARRLEIATSQLPLVGREKERAALVAQLEAALNGLSGLVLIEGEPGVGKTRLLREVARDAAWHGIEVLWGGGEPSASAWPYKPLADALAGGVSPLRIQQLVQVIEPIWLQVLAPLLPPLRIALPDPEPPAPLEPVREQMRLVTALAELLRGWACITPLVVILEDLHWADADTLNLLMGVLPALGASRVLLLGSYRSGEAQTCPDIWHALGNISVRARLKLARLDTIASNTLIRLSLGIGAPAPLFEARLFAETDGNPLYLLETLRTLHSEGLLFRNPKGEWCTPWDKSTHDYAELPLPPAVEQLIARRLEMLPPALRPIVQLAAVLGERFDFDLLRLTSTAASHTLLEALHDLVQRQIFDETTQNYRFHHEKIRQVAYDAITPTERTHLHNQVALALEAHCPEQLAALAHHWERAAVWEKAAFAHQQAGERACKVYANQDALRHYTRALEALARLSDSIDPGHAFALHLARESLYAVMGERRHQAAELDALEAWITDPVLDTSTNRALVALRRSAYYEVMGNYPQAFAAIEEATALAQHLDTAYQAEASWGRMLRNSGALEAARAHTEQAQTLAQMLADPALQAATLNELGNLDFNLGNYDAASASFLRALELCPLRGAEVVQAGIHNSLGNIAHYLADFLGALAHYEQALILWRMVGDRRCEAGCLYNLSCVYHDSGDQEAARITLEQVCTLAHGLGDRRIEGYGWVYLALVFESLEQFDAAREAYFKGLALRREVGLHALAIDALSGLARVATAQGEHGLAVHYADEVLAWLELHGPVGVGDPCLGYLGAYKALLAAGERERGEAALRAAYALLMSYADSISDPERRRAYLLDISPGCTIWEDYHHLGVNNSHVRLPRVDAPLRRVPRADECVTETWTLSSPEDEAIPGKVARRQHRIARLLVEADAQNASPTQADLSKALAVSVATIKRDLAALRRAGTPVKTRGSPK